MIFRALKNIVRTYRFQNNFGLSRSDVKVFLDKNVDDENFFIIKDERDFKENLTYPDQYILNNIKKDAKIYECSCGVGSNLLYLAHRGYSNLYGSDINQSYLDAAQYLFNLRKIKLISWIEDSIELDGKSHDFGPFDVITSFYWSHAIEGFDFEKFMSKTFELLKPGGELVFEAVDEMYNTFENQQYNINDLDKPVSQRRPTQIRARVNNEQIEEWAKEIGYEIIKNHLTSRKVPKRIYILRK